MIVEIVSAVRDAFVTSFAGVVRGFPSFLAGLAILLIGLIIAAFVKRAVDGLFRLITIGKWAEKMKLAKATNIRVWEGLISQIARWAVVILFLVPALESWGIPKVAEVLNQLLVYLPNVLVAAVIGLVGFVVADLLYDVVRHAVTGLGAASATAMAGVSRYAVLVFTALIVLHQLGVAAELIQILFTGFVAMIALAGGLAFGLGGQETARDVLKSIRERL